MNKFLIVVIALLVAYTTAFRTGSRLETETRPDKCDTCTKEWEKCKKNCDKICWDPCDEDCQKKCEDECKKDYIKCVGGRPHGIEA